MKRPVYNALQHLIIAERVCNYVGQKMTLGSPIKPIDMAHSKMRYQAQVRGFKEFYNKLSTTVQKQAAMDYYPKKDLRNDMVDELRNSIKQLKLPNTLVEITATALAAEQSGIGNPLEQAAVGFRYLCKCTKCKVFTLVKVGEKHFFLVLGAGMDEVEGDYNVRIAPNWPEGAVICDPWYNEWFIVEKAWRFKMPQITKITYIHGLVQGTGKRV